MPEVAQKTAAPTPFPQKKSAPEVVKHARVGPVSIRLKRWADGSHSIEISQKDRNGDNWQQVSFGEYDATGIADAIASFRSIAAAK